MLKGRMAETLVEELLRKSGNTIYRFGYEAILQQLTQIKQDFDKNTETGKRIRAIPDFIVLDEKGDTIFLEVKFRWDGKLHPNDVPRLERINTFWSAKLVFVNCYEKPYFRVSNPPYLDEEQNFVCTPLSEESAWKIDPEVYKEFEGLVEKYLKPTLINGGEKKD